MHLKTLAAAVALAAPTSLAAQAAPELQQLAPAVDALFERYQAEAHVPASSTASSRMAGSLI
jgi:hypothetical protein